MNETSWSLGVLAGLPIVIVLVLIFGALSAFGLRRARDEDVADYRGELLFLGWAAAAATAVVAVISLVTFYPYSAEYHQWRGVGGEVQTIDKRLLSTSDGMEEKFVVTFKDGGQQYGCDDTRCASVKPGDELVLTCKRAWQFTGTDGYDCRFVSTEVAR